MKTTKLILIIALMAIVSLMIIPTSAAPSLIPIENYCSVMGGNINCYPGAISDGVLNVDALNGTGSDAGSIEIRFASGAWNITSIEAYSTTQVAYQGWSPAILYRWAYNQSDPSGYIGDAAWMSNRVGTAALVSSTGYASGDTLDTHFEYAPYNKVNNFSPTGIGTRAVYISFGGVRHMSEIKFYGYRTYADPLVADFNGTPTSGVAPLAVTFTDNSTNYPTAWTWNITPSTGWTFGYGALTSQNPTIYFNTNGNYTVALTASNPSSSDTETKTDYIQVHNSTATVNTCFRAKDANGGGTIQSASIHMQDIENASWTNGTTTLGIASINTLTGHHINAYANASGYGDQDYLNQLATDSCFDITMFPSGFANVSAGNVTAYITVLSEDTGQPMSSVSVASQYAKSGNTFGSVVLTNGAGIATFAPLPNNTDVHFAATKAGYGGNTIVVNTGTGNGGTSHVTGEIWLSTSKVTPTITGTITGTGTVTAVQTYLAHCDPSASDYDEAKCRSSQSNSGLDFLAANMGSLIEICVFVTILYLLGIRLGG